jgi:hypothetical protein
VLLSVFPEGVLGRRGRFFASPARDRKATQDDGGPAFVFPLTR